MIILGDCLERLRELPENSVDAVVTDPPYGLSFMGKKWDYDVPSVDIWREVLRVLKPGGHLLSFGGTRTYHRMVVAIEDAGFEVRDMLAWNYGSGFPKSLNVTKQIEKEFECRFLERAKLAVNKSKFIQVISGEEKVGFVAVNVQIPLEDGLVPITVIGAVDDSKDPMDILQFESTELIDSNMILLLSEKLDAASKEKNNAITLTELKTIIDLKIWKLFQYRNTLKFTVVQNHTALKPALEPIVLARKPLIGTVAQNVLEYGTGGLNIDATRIGPPQNTKVKNASNADQKKTMGEFEKWDGSYRTESQGRWPANVIFDEESAALLDEQSGQFKGEIGRPNRKSAGNYEASSYKVGVVTETGVKDFGGASRFFYCAKASKRERNAGLEGMPENLCEIEGAILNSDESDNPNTRGRKANPIDCITQNKSKLKNGNFHPTVKPLKLMQYLIKLITPPGGIVLDPFAGSGSTLVAAKSLGFEFIGIELSAEYVAIAEKRIESVQSQMALGE